MKRMSLVVWSVLFLDMLSACVSQASPTSVPPISPTPAAVLPTPPACKALPGKCPAWSSAPPASAGRITATNLDKLSVYAELSDFPVYDISWSADAKRIALTGSIGIVVYQVDPWQLLLAIDMKGYPTFGLALSPDGKTLAYSPGHNPYEHIEHVVHLIDVDSGRERTALKGHEKTIWGIAFSADGSRLATISDDYQLWIWDVSAGTVIKKFTDQPSQAALTFSPDGKWLLVQGTTGLPLVLDLQTEAKPWKILGEEPDDFQTHFYSAAISPDGRTIITGGDDRLIRLWNVANRKQVGAWVAHDKSVGAVAFAPDGQLFASASRDETIKLWDAATNQLLKTIPWTNSASMMAASNLVFSPDGRYLVAGLGAHPLLKVWGVAP